jgi:hypothetical protein
MRKLQPLQLKPWVLPLVVIGLVGPPIAGFALGGPGVGLPVGALTVAVLIVAAARAGYDEPIEVGSSPGDRYLLLVVALAAVEEPSVAESVAEIARAGAASIPGAAKRAPDVLVLAPALNTRVAHWLSDVRAARFDAQRRLALSVGTLSLSGLEARGQVGDSEVVQAIEDTLRAFPAQEVVFVAGAGGARDAVRDVRRRLDRPVRVLEAAGAQATSSSSRA